MFVLSAGFPVVDCVQMATGQYTGDGTVSQAITGVGFLPKFLYIVEHKTADGGTGDYITSTEIMTGTVNGMSIRSDGPNVAGSDNRIISLDADGFTVDDDGGNTHPNKSGTVYDYICFG